MASRGAQSRWLGNLLLLVGSLVFALVLTGAIELGLRLAGLGEPDASRSSRLKYQQIYLPILEPAVRPDGTSILRTMDPRLPFQSILADKPPGALRVITFGGSATAGLGFSPNVTFARHLERLLARSAPDRFVEVLNLGIVALSSKQVRLLVADACRNYDPDVVIVYSGNNEFLEIHAEKYAAANATPVSRLMDALMGTNLYRFVTRAVRGPPKPPSLAERGNSSDDLRISEADIIQDIEVSLDEVAEIVDRYESNIDAMAEKAAANDVPIVLVTVASNTRWRGREDLPEDWLDELVAPDAGDPEARYQQALPLLTAKLEAAGAWERHEWLFKRAVAHEALGNFAAARDDYRAASDEDPHLRRALGAMAERVRSVGRRRGVPVVDAIEDLSARAEHGIVGFGEFYDYVHFTPDGAMWVAVDLHAALQRLGLLEPADPTLVADYVRDRQAFLSRLGPDPLEVREWLGLGFDPGNLADRDLWKYDRMLLELDERIEADPGDVRALVYRANGAYFRNGGAADAQRDYRAALEAGGDDPAIRANLALLLRDRGP